MRYRRLRHTTAEGLRTHWAVESEGRWQLLDAAPWSGGRPMNVLLSDSEAEVLAPAVPSKVVCVGRNYAAHAKELGNAVPAEPLLFLKPPSSLIGDGGSVVLPMQSERVEHEVELAMIVGKRCKVGDNVGLESVFGWTVANDVTARDLQRRDVQFTRGKGFDTFCPLGPSLETDFDPKDRRVRLWVTRDGEKELRQQGQTSAMVFDPVALLRAITAVMTLEPGDVVLTGTPAGVAPMRAGDEVELEVEGLEALRHGVIDGPGRAAAP